MKFFLRTNYEYLFSGICVIGFFAFVVTVGYFMGGFSIYGLIALLVFILILSSLAYLLWFKWDDDNFKHCPSCRKTVLKDQRYCTGCGFDITPICPSCNAVAGPKDEFCSSCGATLKTPSAITSSANITVLHPTINSSCPLCHARIEPEQAFCGSCGESLEQTVIRKQR